ncbi:phosphatidylinositol 3,4,5-trisphosphate 3-phosphatase TPTE2-like isoform X1 [Sceloporus undulatus]|uniref:phosphatidylinositol 3,4,5-trisphosphate 3-phosphatase TPTE2-like isoform X1 n=2 Tax=Sceloporus undulatus TaxID=8520 RepID=UPI001C4BACC4|nr:phosphatidylinositol 3,4,5-trisphosphate 3-phosphatase TPTE2-like isoform X1 [Sceloporus undulatus]XP_042301408.1 phosphatidylinositol 3,4,5-trisphosphate 3-phosphatase TPTE2-like isoform X1 [Sceloporus undulatus]XP_042301409.1 phosphatidylinositol 3,4,5-trisphosphate 3-phosphatase TPTE2-like isoform X1 [Sceloporus undulatus]XP_042301410.1 phosphatidylinositol 3,4,5-trisphosphate 3-phosphatase TPTE2-like isoform X1 [Sceloporus undulatus]
MKTVTYEQSLELKESLGSHQTTEPAITIDDGTEEEEDEPQSLAYRIKKKISPFVMSFGFRLFGLVLIFVDLVLVVLSLLIGDRYLSLERMIGNISLAIALFFLLDVILRVYVEGFRKYFESTLNILDGIIILGTLSVNIVYSSSDLSGLSQIPRTVIIFRILRIIILIRVFRLASEKERLEKVTRRMVSENKRRYIKDGFDLDLTYVTARVIAMSFPSSGQQAFYRNPIKEVAKFLDTKHEGHYKVYNLCSERGYDPKFFHYRVERIFIDDHNVPTLKEMLKFTASVRKWMQEDENNVIAIHCKGGKGRTGTMVCIWLIDSSQCKSAKESLEYFGERRTDKSTSSKFQGVETPSQSRYVGYYATLKFEYNLTLPPVRSLRIKNIKLYAVHGVGKGNGTDLRVKIIMEKQVIFHCIGSTQENCKLFFDGENDWVVIGLENCPLVSNDVKVRFESSSDIPKGYDDCIFFFWFNTSFIEDNRLYIPRNELDNLHKPRMWKVFRENFAVELNFSEA